MKIALCQMPVGMDKDENLTKADQLVKKAADDGADLVVLPEMFNCPYSNKYFRAFGEREGEGTYLFLSKLAAENKVVLVGGSIPELDGEEVYNTSYVFSSEGNCIGKHRKTHLFDIDIPGGIRFVESDTLTPGSTSTVVDTEFGKIGIAICYDIRFPEFFRNMVLDGAKLIIVPAAFNMTTGPAHWELTARARALDNQTFVAMCSPARDEDGVYVAYGHSLVADAWGNVVSQLDEREAVLYTDIELDACDEIRQNLPLLKHRKPEVYK